VIDVLLASYNGDRYIAEQIDSILAQTLDAWRLLIRDDASTDKTVAIIKAYQEKHPDKILLLESPVNSGSPVSNFGSLIAQATQEYVVTCDQDDVWFPDKLEKSLRRMQEEESLYPDAPVLLHTDAKVVDPLLSLVEPSLTRRLHLDMSRYQLRHLLVQNIVTGSTMMLNRKLYTNVKGFPPHTIMHDWWLALLACATGRVVYLDEPTILYRQHDNNVVGIPSPASYYRLRKKASLVRASYAQASDLLQAVQKDPLVQASDLAMIEAYAQMVDQPKWKRMRLLLHYGWWKNTWIRRIGQLFLC